VNEAFYELVRQIDEWKSRQPIPKKEAKPINRLRKYWSLRNHSR
jgi:hypothetical protein